MEFSIDLNGKEVQKLRWARLQSQPGTNDRGNMSHYPGMAHYLGMDKTVERLSGE